MAMRKTACFFATVFTVTLPAAASAQGNATDPSVATSPPAVNVTTADPTGVNVTTADPLGVPATTADPALTDPALTDPAGANLGVSDPMLADDGLAAGTLPEDNMATTQYVNTEREEDGFPWDLLGLLGLAGLLGLRKKDGGDIHVDARHDKRP